MPKGKEERVEETPKGNVPQPTPEQTPEPEPQTGTFTQEQLDTELERVRQEELAKYQGIQRTIAKKDQKIEELTRTQPTRPRAKGVDQVAQVMLEELRVQEKETGISNPRIPLLEATIAAEKRRTDEVAFEEYRQATIKKERAAIEQKIEDASQDPNDEKFDRVWDAFKIATSDGDFNDARKRTDRILGQVKQPEKEGKELKETEEQRIERLANEKARKMMEEKGLLVTETGGPSATSPSSEEAYAKYIAGEITEEQAKQAGVKFG